jgi:exosortase
MARKSWSCGLTTSVSREPKNAIAGMSPFLQFAFLSAVSVAVGWQPLLRTFALALNADEYTHLLLIVPISAFLILTERTRLKSTLEPGSELGAALLFVAILTACYSRWMTALHSDFQLSISMLAMVIWWIGSFVFCFGARAARLFLFPLCFLFWLVPIPGPLLTRIIAFWQHGSALSASMLFLAFGIPVTQDGIIISIPGLTLEVAQECSSLRSSLMLIVTSMVLAHLFLRSFWRKTAVALAAIPLSIAKNGLRIFTIAMLGTRVDPGFLHGNLHRHGGIVFFLAALLAILLLLWFLNRSESQLSGNYRNQQKSDSVRQPAG